MLPYVLSNSNFNLLSVSNSSVVKTKVCFLCNLRTTACRTERTANLSLVLIILTMPPTGSSPNGIPTKSALGSTSSAWVSTWWRAGAGFATARSCCRRRGRTWKRCDGTVGFLRKMRDFDDALTWALGADSLSFFIEILARCKLQGVGKKVKVNEKVKENYRNFIGEVWMVFGPFREPTKEYLRKFWR